MASAYNDLHDYPNAVKHYIKSIELDDQNMDAYLCLGTVYEAQGKLDKARNVYRRAELLDGENTKLQEAIQKLNYRK